MPLYRYLLLIIHSLCFSAPFRESSFSANGNSTILPIRIIRKVGETQSVGLSSQCHVTEEEKKQLPKLHVTIHSRDANLYYPTIFDRIIQDFEKKIERKLTK
jgi:hypothetical protein